MKTRTNIPKSMALFHGSSQVRQTIDFGKSCLCFIAMVCLLSVACGKNSDDAKNENGNAGGLSPCSLLTAEQVATVLPDADEGFTARQGGSLIEGVDAYQCSYSNSDGDLFTVILNVAVDEQRFVEIKPNPSTLHMIYKDIREVNVGDRGWFFGEPGDMKLKAVKGMTVIDLELIADNAGDKKDAMVEVASAIAQKIK